jgi:hypothetical protein
VDGGDKAVEAWQARAVNGGGTIYGDAVDPVSGVDLPPVFTGQV